MTIKLSYVSNTGSGSAMVEYLSDYDQLIASMTYSASDTITAPDGPSKAGYTFTGWNLSTDEIKQKIQEGETHIVVRPVYTALEETYTITVEYPEGVANEEITGIAAGTSTTVTARQLDGKTFSCWKDADGNVLGYSRGYYLQVMSDITLVAVYDAEVQAQPIIVMGDSRAFTDGGKNKVSFTTSYDLPAGYTLQEVGIIRSTSVTTEAGLVLGGDGVKQHVSVLTSSKGVYTYTIVVGESVDVTVYARGYMIVTNTSTGNSETYYTNFVSGSYNSLSGSTN